MRKPRRIISLILTVIIMFTLTAAAVAADKETSFKDLKNVVSVT